MKLHWLTTMEKYTDMLPGKHFSKIQLSRIPETSPLSSETFRRVTNEKA